jgi:hypothetical protein
VWLAALSVAAVALAAYGLTLFPGIAGGDSAELVAAVVTGGVPHPPGYPLYALLGKVVLLVPIGGPAFRLNLLSAACGAGAAAVLCAAVARRSGSAPAGFLAGCGFAFSPGVWRYAVCAEVFALNNLLLALLLLLAVAYDERAERRYALALALVLGLGLSNHHTVVFAGAPLALWAAWRGRADLLRPGVLGALLLLLLGGLLPYLYLPLAARAHAVVSWGIADTWSGFWTHVLRREYGTFRLAPEGLSEAAPATSILATWALDAASELGLWGLPLCAVGAVTTARATRSNGLSGILLLVPAVAVGVIAGLGNITVSDPLHLGIVARFFQEPDLFLFALVGFGAAELARLAPARVSASVAVAVALVPLGVHFQSMDRRASTLVRAYGAEILRAAPPHALLLTRGDLVTSSVRYLQAVEGERPDVGVVDLELLGFGWYGESIRRAHPDFGLPPGRYMPGAPDGFSIAEIFEARRGLSPTLVCGSVKEGDTSADATFGRWPHGLCEIVHAGTEPVNLDDWLRTSEAALPELSVNAEPHEAGSWEDLVVRDYWEVRQARAAHLLTIAGNDPGRRRYVEIAAEILEDLIRRNPDPPAHVRGNLAIARRMLGRP